MMYLASPYTHPDAGVRERRYLFACLAAAFLRSAGHVVFAPIEHGHSLPARGWQTDWAFWKSFDTPILVHCDRLLVLAIDGWQTSVGVRAEIEIAGRLGK